MKSAVRNTYLFISILLLIFSFYLFYVQPKAITSFFSDYPDLYGHVTSFKLSETELENHLGETVTWQKYSNKPLYVTLGFTSCAHTCPITMSTYKQLADRADKNVNFSLLTVDPERDSIKQLSQFLGGINERFIGFRINNEKILDNVISEFKQSVFETGDENQIIHKGYIYLLHPNVSGLIIYTELSPNIDEVLNDLERLKKVKA